MQNFKLKNRMSVSLLLLLTALFVCFNPGYAFADLLGCMQSEAGRGIFKTMACKITTTLFDIRKIVYILAPISGVPGGSLASMADTTDIKNIKLDPIATAGTEVDTRTGWQKFKDGIKTVAQEGLKAYNTASSVISAAGSVYDAVDSTVKGVQGADGIGGIITAGVGPFDNFTTATGALTGAAGTIGTNYTDKEGEKGLGEKVDDFFKGKNKGANEGKEVTQDLGTINGTANGIMDIPNDIKNIFR